MALRIERFGCFGKLPVSREFLVDDPRRLSESGFDRWVGEGLGLAKARFGPRADRLVAEFPAWRFLWNCGRSHKWLHGLMVAGEDGAGRRHPFTILAWCESLGPLTGATLLALDDLTPIMERLLQTCREAGTPAGALEAVRREPAPPSPDEQVSEAALNRWLQSTRAEDFWGAVFGGTDAARGRVVLSNLEESTAPLRGRDPSGTRYGLAMPLPVAVANRAEGAGATTTPSVTTTPAAAFWLDMLNRELGRPLESGAIFWRAGSEGPAAEVLVFFSQPSGPQWAALIDPDVELESLSVLKRTYPGFTREQLSPAMARRVTRPDARLSDYLDGKESFSHE
ncbi:MAG: type VI secretion system-associated protein TagF [Candidatus Eisenbacteria bacterium]|nr:type VI secretion system-associated protein TagF [Candidatus Eisenbacteria bacterium]